MQTAAAIMLMGNKSDLHHPCLTKLVPLQKRATCPSLSCPSLYSTNTDNAFKNIITEISYAVSQK